jgi:serine/threonine protein kinase
LWDFLLITIQKRRCFSKILKGKLLIKNRGPLKIPKSMSNNAKDLIKKLLCRDPRKRLGANKDSEEIKEHPFF